MTKDEKEDYAAYGCLALVVIGIFAFIGTVYYGVYHLLDKLIDKI